MFSISDSLTIAAAFGNFLLGFIILFKNPRKLLNITFSLFSFVAVLWILANFIFKYYDSGLILKSQYALGALIMPLALIWIYVLVDGKINKKKVIWISIICIALSSAVYLDGLFISDFLTNNGNAQIIKGPLFDYYGFFILGFFLFFVYKLIVSIRRFPDRTSKIQLWFTLWGVILFAGISIFVGFILPLFNIILVGPYDAQSSLFFVTLSAYAILRHKLFDLKIITTELLVSGIWLFLLVKILLSASLTDKIGRAHV